MPDFNAPGGAWLGDRLSRSMGDVETLKKQGTEYIVNAAQECVAIIGNIGTAGGTQFVLRQLTQDDILPGFTIGSFSVSGGTVEVGATVTNPTISASYSATPASATS